jgi:hypothetical protein
MTLSSDLLPKLRCEMGDCQNEHLLHHCTIGPSLSCLVSPCVRAVGVLVSIELKAQKYLASIISNVMVIDGVGFKLAVIFLQI